ncbi:MAG: D-glycero-beta-D-manno-heptose 1-phosphate adenylyltransferase [Bacteroidetes bacterium CG23_combo_of_CG06-09_8_20_14_all_32_9]|nr:MAG: D-glycero-beta-D-manno-heptose 1-phosphate adenylyltransferase [Bacteroidetes bacterium CG23_combo_of_CG06-09_8_20_14_all_32_9]
MEKFEILKLKIFKNCSDIEFTRMLAFLKFKNEKIVFTNGCFDILHRGHIEYLAKAAQFGDVLIIGLNSDESVSRLKGKNRPIQDEESRALVLASMLFVDVVVIFREDTPYNLIKIIKPDVLVKGGDYSLENIIGSDLVIAKGGEVKTINFVDGFSSSSIISKVENK